MDINSKIQNKDGVAEEFYDRSKHTILLPKAIIILMKSRES